MTAAIDRRHFLSTTAAAGVAMGLAGSGDAAGTQDAGANNRLVVGIMGTGGRGTGLATTFQQQPNLEVAYVRDPDRARVDAPADARRKPGGSNLRAVPEFR